MLQLSSTTRCTHQVSCLVAWEINLNLTSNARPNNSIGLRRLITRLFGQSKSGIIVHLLSLPQTVSVPVSFASADTKTHLAKQPTLALQDQVLDHECSARTRIPAGLVPMPQGHTMHDGLISETRIRLLPTPFRHWTAGGCEEGCVLSPTCSRNEEIFTTPRKEGATTCISL